VHSCRFPGVLIPVLSLVLTPQPTLAAPGASTASAVFVEQPAAGNTRRLEPAATLERGARVVTVVTWRRSGGGAFTITSPMPARLAYQASASDNQQVSVDGGRNWGRLGTLRIGNRQATPEDVTHVRWRIAAPVAAKGRGAIAYSGIVR
jgi:hypothetical protein